MVCLCFTLLLTAEVILLWFSLVTGAPITPFYSAATLSSSPSHYAENEFTGCQPACHNYLFSSVGSEPITPNLPSTEQTFLPMCYHMMVHQCRAVTLPESI